MNLDNASHPKLIQLISKFDIQYRLVYLDTYCKSQQVRCFRYLLRQNLTMKCQIWCNLTFKRLTCQIPVRIAYFEGLVSKFTFQTSNTVEMLSVSELNVQNG